MKIRMMFFRRIFSKKKKSLFYVVLDVGTYSIRALSIERGAYRTLGLKKIVSLFSPKEGRGLPQKVGERLRGILFRYIKGLGRIPDAVLLGLASRFTFNTLGVTRCTRPNKNKSVTRAEIEELLNKFAAGEKEFVKGSEKFVLVHAETVHLAIDGYDLNPFNPQTIYGSALELSVALSYVRDDLRQGLEEVTRLLGGIPVTLRPTHLAVASLLAAQNPGKDFLLIKIGGAVTEVSGIKGGVLAWTDAFISGGEDITKKLAFMLHLSLARAEDIKKQYETLLLPEHMANSAKKIITQSVQEWRGALAEILREKQFLLPDTIYIYGGGARLAAIGRALEEKAWAKDLTYRERIVAKTLTAEDLAKNIFVHQPLRGPEDVGLAALASALIREGMPSSKNKKL